MPFGVQFISKKWNDYLLLHGIEELVDRQLLPANSQEILIS
jgi:Asp-tRNA(Asn)/Glu-tRNA(Gln) amidotransferase A subunit family amidase